MADISKDELRKEIRAILEDVDLITIVAEKVRQQIEEKLVDLIERKTDGSYREEEVDDLVMERLQEKQDGGKKKKKAANEKSEDGEKEESKEEEEEGSKEEEEEEKKPKVTPQKNKPEKKGSNSDEDWGKNKKAPGSTAKKDGDGKGKGGGYTRAIALSPELAAVVGAEQMAQHKVVKKIWSIIEERNLYDPKNKQFAICDEELIKVIGVKRFRLYGMMKYLRNHFAD